MLPVPQLTGTAAGLVTIQVMLPVGVGVNGAMLAVTVAVKVKLPLVTTPPGTTVAALSVTVVVEAITPAAPDGIDHTPSESSNTVAETAPNNPLRDLMTDSSLRTPSTKLPLAPRTARATPRSRRWSYSRPAISSSSWALTHRRTHTPNPQQAKEEVAVQVNSADVPEGSPVANA